MARRFLCLQGHQWADEEQVTGGRGGSLFCPTCGLRLHLESDLSRFVHPAPALVPPVPTPMFHTDVFRLSLASAGPPSIPEIQPSDIEEIPGYELLGILGRGGMGIVFRARQLSLKRQVALKMILTGRHARLEDRVRFQKEAEAVARLQHPNIVQIYEVGEQNGLPFFSLEFVNAGSLSQFLGGNPQDPDASARVLLEVARAMHYAHKRGIVHRDLKPANVLLHLDEGALLKNGQGPDPAVFRDLSAYVPKISDFGLAKHMGGEEQVLRHGSIIGTPSYMAPEQAQGGAREIGPAADVYALGAILYEMLTGRPPFRAMTVAETAQQVLHDEPVAPTQFQPKVPKDLETICLACLQKQPESRYPSAEALAEDLRRFLGNEPILARVTAPHERVVKWARRRPAAAAVVGGAALLAVLLFHGWGRTTVSLRGERDQAVQDLERTGAHIHKTMQAIDQLVLAADPLPAAPGPDADARRRLLEKGVAFYRRIVDETKDDVVLRPLAAHAHRRLGELQYHLGDADASRAAYTEAARVYQLLGVRAANRAEFVQHAKDCLKHAAAKAAAEGQE